MREAAWISARIDQGSFINEHVDWVKHSGDLARIGLPDAAREAI